MNIRAAGKKLVFYDLTQDNKQIQIFASLANWKGEDSFNAVHNTIKRGDIVGVKGFPGRTKTGELSVSAVVTQSLSYCLHILPTAKGKGLTKDTRYRQRYLDLIVNN